MRIKKVAAATFLSGDFAFFAVSKKCKECFRQSRKRPPARQSPAIRIQSEGLQALRHLPKVSRFVRILRGMRLSYAFSTGSHSSTPLVLGSKTPDCSGCPACILCRRAAWGFANRGNAGIMVTMSKVGSCCQDRAMRDPALPGMNQPI